jgi:carboxylesterase
MKKEDKIQDYRGDLVIPGGRCGVLLVHSLGGNPIEMRFVAQSLARLGYTVHCPMLQGLAGGTDVLGLSQWTDWYAAVERAYEKLKAECDVVLVGGMSAGAMLGLRLAAEKRDGVHALMLFAPTLWPNGWSIPWYFNFFKLVRHRFVARMFHFKQREPFGIKDERIRNFVIDSFKSDNRPVEDLFGRGGATILQFRLMVKEVRKVLGDIRQPTLIFHPRFDDQSDLANTVKLQRSLGGIVETCVLDDSYHMVTLDRQRGYVVDRTVDFAKRQTQRIADAAAVARLVKNAAKAAE